MLNLYPVRQASASVDLVKIDESEKSLEAIADQLNSATKANFEQDKKLIEQVQIKAQNYQQQTLDYTQTIVKNIEDNVSKYANRAEPDINANSKKTNITARILNEYKELQQAVKGQDACQASRKDGLKIFISFSMPKEVIQNYDIIARKIGAKLIIRGLINNSFKETMSYIKKLNEQGMIIDIDPRPFSDFKINFVPSFVINSGDKYDKLVGNVSVIYALEQFAANGETAALAKDYLERLSKVGGFQVK